MTDRSGQNNDGGGAAEHQAGDAEEDPTSGSRLFERSDHDRYCQENQHHVPAERVDGIRFGGLLLVIVFGRDE